eukprot:m.66179 g.66179  ORF g.66179 m.66179 type:complete len:448 (-) comp12107_c0_seq1:218-1561(-)
MDRQRVRQLVYQYLVEEGLALSAMAMKDEAEGSGDASEEDSVTALATSASSGQLLHLLDTYEHMVAAQKHSDEEATKESLTEMAAAEQQSPHYCNSELDVFEDHHSGNIIACCLTEDGQLVSGGADRVVKTIKLTGLPDASVPVGAPEEAILRAPVLCVAKHPTLNLVAAGDMGGQCSVVSLETNEVVCTSPKKHSKYLVRSQWSPCGTVLVTASYDKTLNVYRCTKATNAACTLIHATTLSFDGTVECVCFCPTMQPSQQVDQGDEVTAQANNQYELVVGVRNDCRLHIIELHVVTSPDIGDAGPGVAVGSTHFINMNELHDDYVSFSAMDVALSPSGRFLLVATDKHRVLLVSRRARTLLAVLYGTTNDEYSNPRCCWDSSERYAYATSQSKEIIVWDTTTQQVVSRLSGHTGVIRDMAYSAALNTLVSCGFDKSVRLWSHLDAI